MNERRPVKIIIPDAATIRARQRLEDERARFVAVKTIRFRPATDRFDLMFQSGLELTIPRKFLTELDGQDPKLFSNVRAGIGGWYLEFAELDVHISMFGLLRDLFGMNEGQRNGGRSRSTPKVAASRANGALGGRPKKASLA